MADWVTISSMATAGGTLVLAVATFSSVRSGNRSARVAERSLLAGQRPVLIPSRDDDLDERVRFGDGVVLTVPGHGSVMEVQDGRVYLAIGLRNGGAGLAVIHGWHAIVSERRPTVAEEQATVDRRPELDSFRRQARDLYVPAGATGFWQGAVRDSDDPDHEVLVTAAQRGQRVLVDLLYGDYEGGQRTIARFAIGSAGDGEPAPGELRRSEAVRYWNVDREDPR